MKNLAVQDLTHEAPLFSGRFFFLPSHKRPNWEADHNKNFIPVFCFFLKFLLGVRNEDIHSDQWWISSKSFGCFVKNASSHCVIWWLVLLFAVSPFWLKSIDLEKITWEVSLYTVNLRRKTPWSIVSCLPGHQIMVKWFWHLALEPWGAWIIGDWLSVIYIHELWTCEFATKTKEAEHLWLWW